MARSKSHRKSHRKTSKKNIINKTFDQSVSVVKSTSRKYMPKVKSGLENVGSKVVSTGTKTIPFLQNMTRKFFGLFSTKKSKSRKNRK
jgi:ribosomal protein S20